MRKVLLLSTIAIILSSCDNTTLIQDTDYELAVLPQPKLIDQTPQQVLLSERSKLFSPDPEVYPLLELFIAEVQKISGVALTTTSTRNEEADIIFEIDSLMPSEDYIIEIDKNVKLVGASYQALARAKSTLLQLIESEEKTLKFPLVKIRDRPDASYRGLMIDLARKWHKIETIKKLIDMAAFYKCNFVQLHFTDYQSYTLPSKKYPKLSTQNRHYSFEQLRELEAYSQLRGVTIIPELEVPGHSSQFVKKYPGIFAIKDTVNNPWIINMGKEETYEALDKLIEELASVFKTTPYIHIGGDEAIFNKVMEDPNVIEYAKQHQLGDDVDELYRHFLVRMNSIVKKHHKIMCVWEGFGREGKLEIPKDIIVFEFETNRYLPTDLIEDGYTVVNTSWKPLYVVNQKKWEPATIYAWNMWRWENWWDQAPSFKPIQVAKSPLVIGAQMCSWEQAEEVEVPSLRKRLPVFMERIWNTEKQIPFEEVSKRVDILDKRLSILIDDERQDSLLNGYNFSKELLESRN